MTLNAPRLARLLLAASLLPVCALAADPTVRRIQVELDGPGAVADAYVLGHVSLREGQPFNREAAADSVRMLYATGRFSQAEVLPALDTAAGQVDVRIRVQLRPLVESVAFSGLEGLVDEDDLLEDLGVKAGDPLDPVALNQGRVKALERLRKKRPFAGLEIRPEPVPDGRVRLVAVAALPPELRVGEVSIRGAEQLDEDAVLAEAGVKSASWRWWKLSGLTGGGRLSADDYREDCERIVAHYRARGFLDAEMETTDAALACVVRDVEGDEGWVDVVFRLREGRRYAVGTLTVAGNDLGKAEGSPFSTAALLDLVGRPSARSGLIAEATDRLAPGGWYSAAAVEVAVEKVREAYGRRGHLDVQIGVARVPNLETGAIDLRLEIREGGASTVRQVVIEGNTKTRAAVIARELTLQPGDVFDLEAARRSESRLRNTRFFENVRLTPVPTAVPEQRDLLVALKEGPTGMVSFGAGFSSVEQLVGFVEYSEGNFDALNPEGWFRGGGQKFRLRVSAGNLSNSIEHSFEEPALWERDLAVGYNLYQRFSGFQSSYYDLQTRGADVYARRNILGVQARLSAGVRSVDLRDPNVPLLPADILATAAAGAVSIPELSLSLARDTRDDFTFPTRGFRAALTNTYAGGGLGGDVDYLKTDLRLGRWFLISREATQTLALVARAGTYQDFEELPFYERQQLGGAYDLRGFKYNYVGSPDVFQAPVGSPTLFQPVGGLTYGFLSAEYTIKASDTLRWAVFTDWGFVNRESNDFSPGQLNGDAGIGLRILLGGAVLRLDFGFPLRSTVVDAPGGPIDVNDDGMQLNFSFGTFF